MPDQRALAAVRRIESALARVEGLASRLSAQDKSDQIELERVRTAHEHLRRQVSGAIGQIDKLLQSGRPN
jgi:hypothetical protein